MAIVVKNTFLAVERRSCAKKRCSSVTWSFKPSVFVEQPCSNATSSFKPSVLGEQQDSTAESTYSACASEPWSFKPSVLVEQPRSNATSSLKTSVLVEQQDSTAASSDSALKNDSILSQVFRASGPDSQARSKSKSSSSFQWEPSMRFKPDLAKVVKRTMKTLRSSKLIANVQTSERSHEFLLTVQMSAAEGLQKEQVQAFVQEALLDGVIPSKSIYIIGFSGPSPFIQTAVGFDFKYGAMENARTACWYFFKKGFCRHGDQCKKHHTVLEMSVHVRIEASLSESPEPPVGWDIKKEI